MRRPRHSMAAYQQGPDQLRRTHVVMGHRQHAGILTSLTAGTVGLRRSFPYDETLSVPKARNEINIGFRDIEVRIKSSLCSRKLAHTEESRPSRGHCRGHVMSAFLPCDSDERNQDRLCYWQPLLIGRIFWEDVFQGSNEGTSEALRISFTNDAKR